MREGGREEGHNAAPEQLITVLQGAVLTPPFMTRTLRWKHFLLLLTDNLQTLFIASAAVVAGSKQIGVGSRRHRTPLLLLADANPWP